MKLHFQSDQQNKGSIIIRENHFVDILDMKEMQDGSYEFFTEDHHAIADLLSELEDQEINFALMSNGPNKVLESQIITKAYKLT
jgi:hypothetical protein